MVKDILKRSTKAVCGTAEREVVVKSTDVSRTISKLKASGFKYVGKGPAGMGRTKIWFVRRGLELL